MTSAVFNPLDPQLFTDPHPLLDELRENDPVYHEPALGMFVITGHAEAMQAMREPGGDLRYVEFQHTRVQGDVESQPYLQGMREWILMKGGDEHKRIRKVFSRHFTPQRVAGLRPALESTAHALIDTFAADGHAELLDAFAKPLPLAIITELLDVPAADQERISDLVDGFKVAVQALPMTPEQLTVANDGISGLGEYFTALIADRREHPGEDLLTMMIQEADAGAFTHAELVTNAWGLYAAGHETSSAAICNGVRLLCTNPEQLAALQANWSRVDSAVEEILRMDSPGFMTHRLFDHDLHVGGHTIPANTPVLIYLLGASRDPRHWACPHQFDPERPHIREHFGLGQGIHRCLGQHLAHATVATAMQTLFTRLPDLTVERFEWSQHSIFHGPSQMTVSWTPQPTPGSDHA